MIFFGTRGVKSTIKEGKFNCPQCEAEKSFKHKKVTKFFTLYFIPIIPLGSAGEFVECQTCKGTFIPKVIDYNKNVPSDKFLSEYEKAMKHCMVLIMLADGQIDENEMLVVQKIINKFGHNDISLDELEKYVNSVHENPEDLSTYLKKITPMLNEHGKEVVIKCAITVAASDGDIDDSELKLIQEMANIMEMSPSHVRGIFQELLTPETVMHSDN